LYKIYKKGYFDDKNMILQFKVNNFRSIKDTVILNMQTDKNKQTSNSFTVDRRHLLKSCVIYGANASGKSNVLKAMSFMREMVLNSSKVTQSTDSLPYAPFRLNTETETASSHFEIIFLHNDFKYRYGFEMDSTTVYAEWLFIDMGTNKESRLFERDVDTELYINPAKFKEGRGVKVPDNQLLLWRCDQQGGELSKLILQWFFKFNFIDGLEHKAYFNFALKQMQNDTTTSALIDLLNKADLGIDDLVIEEKELSLDEIEQAPIPAALREHMLKEQGQFKSVDVRTQHKKFDANNQLVGGEAFQFERDESQGTQKFFALSAPILDTLKYGKVLLIDELDSSLHPKLTEAFIRLFLNPEINQHNAQLIFTTHDTNLLSVPQLFERDQIWFTEKDQYGSTELYSLLEFRKNTKGKDVRETDNLEKHYLQGVFGATPYLGEF